MPIDSVKWATGQKDAFVDWLAPQLQSAIGTHDDLVQHWIRLLRQYRPSMERPLKSVPYEGASNEELPFTAIDVDPLFAKFIQTIHAADNVWTIEPLNERWVEAAKPVQDMLTWLDGNCLNMFDVNLRAFMEMVKLGTAIYKTGWTYKQEKVTIYENGKAVKALKTTGKPFVDHVKLANFVLPPTATSEDPDHQGGALWVAERMQISKQRLMALANSTAPYLPNLDKTQLDMVLLYEERGQNAYDEEIRRLDYEKGAKQGKDFYNETTPAQTSTPTTSFNAPLKEIELWEVHARFSASGGVAEEDVIVLFHFKTRRILRAVYNYYNHGKRPYEVIRYFPGDGFYGIGVCEQKEPFQRMGSDLFNFTKDNVQLVNSRMFVAKAGANIQPGEVYYPGKVWITDGDVRQDFGIMPMAEVYPSLDRLQAQVQQMGERRTGISDIQLGQMQDLPGRTPATTMMSLMQEGNRRPDLTLKIARNGGLSRVGLRTLQNCQQFMSSEENVGGQDLLKQAMTMLGQREGTAVVQLFSSPNDNVESGLGVQISATSGSANKEVEKQHYLEVLQVAGQISQQILQFTQVMVQFQGTPIAMAAQQAIHAILEIGKRLLEQMDIKNIDAIIPDTTQPQIGPGQPQQQQGVPGQPGQPSGVPAGPLFGPVGQPPVPPAGPGLAAIPAGA